VPGTEVQAGRLLIEKRLLRGNWIAGLLYEHSLGLLQEGNHSRVESIEGLAKSQAVKLVAVLPHWLRQRRPHTASLSSLLKHIARRSLAKGEMPYPNWSRP